MIIGVLLSVVLLFFVPTVLRAVNVPSYEAYSAKHVFVRVGDVITYILKLGNVIKQSQEDNQFRGNPYYNPDATPSLQEPAVDGYQL